MFAAHFAEMWWAYLVILVMVLLSAYFSASEIAFNASNKLRLRRAAESGSKTAKVAYGITEKFTTALSAILIGNNLANIAVSTCTTLIVIDLFSGGNVGLASTLATIIVTVVILICGEIVPKVLSKQKADVMVRIVAIPTRILTILLSPIVAIVMAMLFLLRKLWGKDRAENDPTVTEEELVTIIDTVEEEGVIDEEQGELLQSTIDFHDTTVSEIMTPRIDMTALDIDDDAEKLREILSDTAQYSRLPVYEDSIDNIIGVLSLSRYYKATLDTNEPDIRELMMKPCKLHKTMKLPAALNKLREMKMHLAIVIDEFGGTLGVVTMEDILEELVGDIWDDTDVIVHEC
ncbi:MAG: HlyC/CorC family transporter, partial [Clostridia bacterium]|nr:HlyC/CorC family transporter [Clostridia bacterium]